MNPLRSNVRYRNVFLLGAITSFTLLWGWMVYKGWPHPAFLTWPAHPVGIIALGGLAAWALSRPHAGWLTGWICLCLMFGGQLAETWASPRWMAWQMGGIFSFTDPAGYTSEAARLVYGMPMRYTASWRPLPHGFLATHLWLTDFNIRMAHLLYGLWYVTSLILTLRVIAARVHPVAAGIWVVLVVGFAQVVYGSFMTENLGLVLGSLALACIVEGTASRQSWRWYLMGLTLLTLALTCRAGAFFVLPSLIVWICWVGAQCWWDRAKLGCLAILMVAAVLLASMGLKYVISEPSGASNFSYTFYGMVHGKDWQFALATGLSTDELFSEAIDTLIQRPWLLGGAVFRAANQFVSEGMDFAWVMGLSPLALPIGLVLQFSALLAVAIGLIHRSRRPLFLLFPLFLFGFFISLPFAPPWDAGPRIYAATAPFIFLMGATGFLTTRLLQPRRTVSEPSSKGLLARGSCAFAGAFVLCGFLVPSAMRAFGNPEAYPALTLPDGRVQIPLNAGSIVQMGHSGHSYPPHLNVSTWLKGSWPFEYFNGDEAEILKLLPSGVLLAQHYGSGLFVLPESAKESCGEVVQRQGYMTAVGGLTLFIDSELPDLMKSVLEVAGTGNSHSPVPFLRDFNFHFYPWVSHPRLGAMWVFEDSLTVDEVKLFSRDPAYGHLSTSRELYPSFIRKSDNARLEYRPLTGDVFDHSQNKVIPLPQEPEPTQ